MNNQEYIRNKLTELKQKYNAEAKLSSSMDKEFNRLWKREYQCKDILWREINSVLDVKRYVNYFVGIVEQYENIRGLYIDRYDMDLALYKATISIQKMVQCYDNDELDFQTLEEADIDKLFDTLYDGIDRMDNVNMRRAMQD